MLKWQGQATSQRSEQPQRWWKDQPVFQALIPRAMSKSFQESHRTAPVSFRVVCKTFLEAWQELSFQGREKAGFLHLGTTLREGQNAAVSQWATDRTVFSWPQPFSRCCHCCRQERTCSGLGQPTSLLTLCPRAERAGDHGIPTRAACAVQAEKCWFGSAPSYSPNPLLTPSQPIFGCFPWSRHCFPTAPFQKELKEMSSVAFFLVCAKTIS